MTTNARLPHVKKLFALLAILACTVLAESKDPPLVQAYAALREKSYDAAVQFFLQELTEHPGTPQIHKDLAYTYLKIGENEAARDHFADASRIDPTDVTAALEYAFLCNDTKQQALARRIFDRLRKTGNKTAEQAFQNIDAPLAEGIDRWKKALDLSPNNFSAHEELARLAENRDDLKLAADQYNRAWQLRPQLRGLLIDLGRVWMSQDRIEEAHAAWLSASRATDARTAENARALLITHTCMSFKTRSSWIHRMWTFAGSSHTCILRWDTRPRRNRNLRPLHSQHPATPCRLHSLSS
jgi:Tfp pilus assembly protein PilF